MATPPNRDLPEVVSELIIEVHEVRSELNAINGRIDRLERTMDTRLQRVEQELGLLRIEMRTELQEASRSIVEGITRGFEPFLNRLLDHDDQLKKHAGRLNTLENPQA
ncbi:hypothetical protein QMK33_20960 [Hymenobacter sp. H14-R3]|uniref:hypothetical protein n=1 Tax=Hymenobacter sp. H14-R3 TaxID=3046308 RepID=UPI0024BBE6B4|nr:hypothetical protein [Hymenobacter sp. H14-R3]MDJ0367624.1 hypothetical protein [Hymenobacter sp. H14-R3]